MLNRDPASLFKLDSPSNDPEFSYCQPPAFHRTRETFNYLLDPMPPESYGFLHDGQPYGDYLTEFSPTNLLRQADDPF
jgi:hypothetical protein